MINKREEVPLSGSLREENVKRFSCRLRTSVVAMIGVENRESDRSSTRASAPWMGLKILFGDGKGESAKGEDEGDQNSSAKSNPRLRKGGTNRALEIARATERRIRYGRVFSFKWD